MNRYSRFYWNILNIHISLKKLLFRNVYAYLLWYIQVPPRGQKSSQLRMINIIIIVRLLFHDERFIIQNILPTYSQFNSIQHFTYAHTHKTTHIQTSDQFYAGWSAPLSQRFTCLGFYSLINAPFTFITWSQTLRLRQAQFVLLWDTFQGGLEQCSMPINGDVQICFNLGIYLTQCLNRINNVKSIIIWKKICLESIDTGFHGF